MEGITDLVSLAIERAEENIKTCGKWKELSPKDWYKMFCTVRLDVGRCTGKTTAIRELVETGDLVCSKFDILRGVVVNGVICVDRVMKLAGLNLSGVRRVLVDEPSMFFRKDVDVSLLYSIIYESTGNRDITFIFLGK